MSVSRLYKRPQVRLPMEWSEFRQFVHSLRSRLNNMHLVAVSGQTQILFVCLVLL